MVGKTEQPIAAHEDSHSEAAWLRESERRFRNYFDQGLIGMATTALNARWLETNDRLCQMLGYRREELFQKTWKELTHPEDLSSDVDQFNRLLAGEIDHYTLDKRFLRKDGATLYTTIHIRAFREPDGSIDHIVALLEDITERRLAQQALQVSEQRYRAVVEDQTELINRFKSDGTLTFVNNVFCRFFGKTPQELLGTRWQSTALAEDLPKVESQLDALSPTNPVVTVENRVLSGAGEARWMQFVNRGLFDQEGHLTEVQTVGRDITQRKQAEESLRQNNVQLRAICDGMVEGLMIADIASQRIRRVNASFCHMLGYGEQELLTKSVADLHPPEEVAGELQRFQAAAEGRLWINEDRPVLRKDGGLFYADITAHRIGYEGQPCLLALFRDISERKQAQKALQREKQSLWQMLQASDHDRQTISYEIHDGLAQYLAAAAMQLQVAARLRESDSEEARQAFDAAMQLVNQSHQEARRLISQVRPPIIDETGLETAIDHLVHEQSRQGGPEIECRTSTPFDRLPTVLENALYRIVQEALTNACKYSRSEKVLVTLTQHDKEVCLEVQDWGIGFDPDKVEQGHFGLEGIRQRVRLLAGQLTIESRPGHGTRVQAVVPVLESPGIR